MDILFGLPSPLYLGLAFAVAALAGFVKGAVGFAMPMILISGLSSFVSPEIALAGLLVPTLVTNLIQALRQGVGAAWGSILRFRVFLIVGAVALLSSAQLVLLLPVSSLLLVIGVPITLFALIQLAGWHWTLRSQSAGVEAGVGLVAGGLGGLSGVWGPATVLYLTALSTDKKEQMRVQGVVYGLGAILLVGAHSVSGILRSETLPLSVALVAPSLIGMWLGGQILDRINQAQFRKATLAVLFVVGLNLIRRALFA